MRDNEKENSKAMGSEEWLIVSNRLPYSLDTQTGELKRSSGGLVSAISGITGDSPVRWLGVAPSGISADEWEHKMGTEAKRFEPVFVCPETYDHYYNGLCNNVLWPLLHYESRAVHFKWGEWAAYREINQQLTDALARVAQRGQRVWIHDFHLMLIPALLRKLRPDLKIGFFLHVPFPSSEVFRQLPVRKELLEGVLASDLIGFHDYSYLRHFTSTCRLVLGCESSLVRIRRGRRITHLGVYPVGIDTARFQSAAKSAEVRKLARRHQNAEPRCRMVLGVDRMDYTKGIELKLAAFRDLLEHFPQYRGNICLIQVAVPSRIEVPEVQKLKQTIEEMVGEINGRFGTPFYSPVRYVYSSVSFDELVALYCSANAMLITSRRDGMNLVALEYLASQNPSNPGVLLLSEFTGAVGTLADVVPINPWDSMGTAKALDEVLSLRKETRVKRHARMIAHLEKYTSQRWALSFMKALDLSTKGLAKSKDQPILLTPSSGISKLHSQIASRPLLIFLDYDGTLVPIADLPWEATVTPELTQFLCGLKRSNQLRIVVVSGRDSKFLESQFRGYPVSLAAEHGSIFYDLQKKRWRSLVRTNVQQWLPTAKQIMADYADQVPHSFVELKKNSVCWHYRLSPTQFAAYQARKLREELEMGMANLPVTIISGKKVVEARPVEANKGTFARWYTQEYLQNPEQWAVMGIGDDQTDEDLFSSLPSSAISLKVGPGTTLARFRVASQEAVLPLLRLLKEERI